MSTQNRDNFQWRPNDNSVTTNVRYDLEMNHWLKSFSSKATASTFELSSSFFVIGLIFSLSLNIILYLLILLSDSLSWIIDRFHKDKPKITKPKKPPMPSKEKLDNMCKNVVIMEDDSS